MRRLMAALLILTALSGCQRPVTDGAPAASAPGDTRSDGKISVVCTIFPQYDWLRQIIGDNEIELTLLQDGRVDLHSYQPSVDDIIRISACDLFIYVGGESDMWVEGVLRQAANPGMLVINRLDVLGDAAKTETLVEGMEDDDDDDDDDHGDDHEAEYDEHVWLSLRNAAEFCSVIAGALSSIDTDSAAVYNGNLAAYTERLSALDAEYKAAADAAPVKTLLFGDRFPFRYLTDDYGLEYYAAFPGCSAETEASFQTIVFLAGKADELGLKAVMVTESADQSIARTVIDNTTGKNQRILALDSMQSVTPDSINGGVTYLSLMESNLSVLKDALN